MPLFSNIVNYFYLNIPALPENTVISPTPPPVNDMVLLWRMTVTLKAIAFCLWRSHLCENVWYVSQYDCSNYRTFCISPRIAYFPAYSDVSVLACAEIMWWFTDLCIIVRCKDNSVIFVHFLLRQLPLIAFAFCFVLCNDLHITAHFCLCSHVFIIVCIFSNAYVRYMHLYSAYSNAYFDRFCIFFAHILHPDEALIFVENFLITEWWLLTLCVNMAVLVVTTLVMACQHSVLMSCLFRAVHNGDTQQPVKIVHIVLFS